MSEPEKKKVFITVKTYPALSVKYDELVCTAGITDKGKWIRIYPVPFRKLQWEKQYKKYQWIELECIRNHSDFRPESYSPTDRGKSIKTNGFVKDWNERKKIIFKEKVYKNIKSLIAEAKDKQICTSLSVFKPAEILDFKIELVERQWDAEKIQKIKQNSEQLDLFDSDKNHEIFQIVKKLPYKFSYTFRDEEGNESTLMIEDWEIGALYWNCLKRAENEHTAIRKVKEKYLNEFKQKDLYLFLGTVKQFHKIAPNPFIIIGVFYPPVIHQQSFSIE